MASIETHLKHSSALVKTWGLSDISDGRTLDEALTIEGISLWSVISPVLASTYISKALLEPSTGKSIQRSLKELLENRASLALFHAKSRLSAGIHGCASWPNDETFLCLGFSRYIYRETVEPLAASLARRRESSVVVIDDSFSFQPYSARNGDVMCQTLWQHWCPAVSRNLKKMRKSLEDVKAHLTELSELKEIVQRSGRVWGDFQRIFSWLFNAYMPRLLVYVAIAKHVVAHHRPALMISPDVSDPRTRIFCLAGKLVNIKTIEIQFSFYGPSDVEWDFFLADHLAVTGSANLAQMCEHGISPTRMTITGSPRYDAAIFRSSEINREIRDKYCKTDGKQMVLFASQPYYQEAFADPGIRRDMISDLFSAASNASGIILVVKPHPLDNLAELVSLAKGWSNIIFADRHLDIRNLIRVADIFVTFFSSTAFDALVMGKPTITLAYPGGYYDRTFEIGGATLRAEDKLDIQDLFHSIGSGKIAERNKHVSLAKEQFLSSWFYLLDGCATNRIQSIALGMVSSAVAYATEEVAQQSRTGR